MHRKQLHSKGGGGLRTASEKHGKSLQIALIFKMGFSLTRNDNRILKRTSYHIKPR